MYFLAAGAVPTWVSASFPTIRMVLLVLMVIVSIFMIISVLTQPAASEGLGAVSGGQDSFFGKSKGRTVETVMKKLTVIAAILLVVISVLFFVSLVIYSGK